MRVHAKKDTFDITDGEIQTLIKQYVEAQTGRKVEGSVFINTHQNRSLIGDHRDETYTASGILEDKA